MNREMLIEGAQALTFDRDCALEYGRRREEMVSAINQDMAGRPDILELVGGEVNLAMMRDNHANHARFVESILLGYNPEVLVDTVLWVFRAYRSRGFHPNYWAAQLNTWVDILQKFLPREIFTAVYPLYNWFIVNIPHFTDIAQHQLTETHPAYGHT